MTPAERFSLLIDAVLGRRRHVVVEPPPPEPPPPEPPPPPEIRSAHPGGHFYSPIVDPAEALAQAEQIWPAGTPDVAGIDFNEAAHHEVLDVFFPRFLPDFDYAEHGASDEDLGAFYIRNSQFSWLDARTLFVLLRAWRPARIVEVGSGYSTLLIEDVARRFLDGATAITAIEPHPRPFLARLGIELHECRVQDAPPAIFERLQRGDVLFIDSSHVAKTGSDVNYLFFEILPRLKPGVRIHVHDIFLPGDYPKEWVLTENRSWNEQYILRALLMYSTRFRVLFGCANAYFRHRERLASALGVTPERTFGGGSLWLEVADG